MRRVGLFSRDKTICAEGATDTGQTSHSGLLSLIVTGRGEEGKEGKEAAEDDGKGQLEIHELD